jgi:ABC-2 type transport system permease protein
VVGVLLRLRLTLLRNQAGAGLQPLLLMVVGVLVAGGTGLVVVAGLVGLRFAPTDLSGAAVVVFGSIAVIAWAVLPVQTSSDEVLTDPVRFALLPVPTGSLAAGLLLASMIGPFAVVTLLVPLAAVVTFAQGPAPVLAALVAVVGGLLGSATCLLGSRAVLTAAASTLSGRRGRETVIGVGVVLIALLGLTGPALAALGEQLQTGAIDAAVAVLAWSPLGAAWAMPWAASQGQWWFVLGRGTVAVATVALLWWAYVRAVRARLRPVGGGRRSRGQGEATRTTSTRISARHVLPDTAFGALVQRCLRYWVRDSRYVVSVLALPVVFGLMLTLPLLTDAPPGLALVAGPLLGLLLGFTMLNELAFDGTAVWITLASGVRGRDERAARVVAMLLWATPFTVVVAVLGAVMGGRPDLVPASVGLSVGTLLVGNGVAAVASVAWPFPVPPAGSNPFAGNPGSTTAALVQQGLSTLILGPLLLPLLALAAAAWFYPVAGWVLLVLGPVLGAVLLVVGIRIGGRLFDGRGPDLVGLLAR